MKDNSINVKLVKCYSQIGLSTDENVILGNCSIDQQLDFLHLLTVFIKSIYLTTDASSSNNENANPNVPKTSVESCCDKVKLDESNTQNCIDLGTADELCYDIKNKVNDLNDSDLKWNQTLQQFNSSFKKIVKMPIQDTNTNVFSSYNELNADIQQVVSLFSTVNKTLDNESQLKNRLVVDEPLHVNNELSQVLQNNLVSVEQACNIRKDEIC